MGCTAVYTRQKRKRRVLFGIAIYGIAIYIWRPGRSRAMRRIVIFVICQIICPKPRARQSHTVRGSVGGCKVAVLVILHRVACSDFDSRPRSHSASSEVTDHAWPPIDATTAAGAAEPAYGFRATPTSKSSEIAKDNGYLKNGTMQFPVKTGIETNLSGLITQVWSLTHIW